MCVSPSLAEYSNVRKNTQNDTKQFGCVVRGIRLLIAVNKLKHVFCHVRKGKSQRRFATYCVFEHIQLLRPL
jgi:hypothetical protein